MKNDPLLQALTAWAQATAVLGRELAREGRTCIETQVECGGGKRAVATLTLRSAPAAGAIKEAAA